MRPFADALAKPGLSLIAEHKRRSPSAGVIRDGLALEDVVTAYERAGAAALSILTEERSFGGSLDDLRAARAASALPILRKDFIVDPYQVHESLAAGADAILLIVAALAESTLAELHALARELGLAALVEVHDRDELAAAVAIGAEIIGINNRDLTTLKVDHAPDVRAAAAAAGRDDRSSPSPASAERDRARAAGRRRGRRRADRRGADALGGHRGRLPRGSPPTALAAVHRPGQHWCSG